MESNFFNLIETIYKKHTVNIILNDETLSFPAKIKYKAKMSHNSTPLQHRSIVKVLTNAVRRERNKGYTDCDGRNTIIFVHR